LILRKIETVATRCQILWLKRIKFDFSWGFAPDPLGSTLSVPDPVAGFKGPTSKGRGRERREGYGSRGDQGRKRREGK